MKNNKSISGYSRAIFEIAVEEGKEKLFFDQLKEVQASLSKELQAFVENPVFSDKELRDVLSQIADQLELDQSLKAFIVLVAEQRRLDRFDEIVNSYRGMYFEAHGKALMEIYSAKALPKDETLKLVDQFSKKLNKELEIETHTDPGLIGGVIVKIGSQYFDGSLRGRLEKLRESLYSQN